MSQSEIDVLRVDNDELIKFASETLQEGTSVTLRVKGNSMFPFLRNFVDCVVIEPVGLRKMKRGDIILFKYLGTYLLHRIIALDLKNDIIYVRGDNRRKKGYEIINHGDIVGIVSSVLKNNEKTVYCDSFRWKFTSSLWMFFYPVIYYLRKCYYILNKK